MNSFNFRRSSASPTTYLLAALLSVATLLFVYSCDKDGEGIVSPDNGDDNDLDERWAQYVQAVAEKSAPLLLFDKEQGQAGSRHCFPMDAGEYWDLRKSGERGVICNNDFSTVTVGGSNPPAGDQVPVYYIYQKCIDWRAIGALNGLPGGTGCVRLAPSTNPNDSCGSVCIEPFDTLIRITYRAADDWGVTAAHLWVGVDMADIPLTTAGNPRVELFPNRQSTPNGVASCSFDVAVSEFDTVLNVAAYATLRRIGTNETTSAWGNGLPIGDPDFGATCITVDINVVVKIEYLMYWFFYGWQDYCDGVSGAHHADWERVVVKTLNGSLHRVLFYQHSGWYTRNPGNYEVVNGHPCVYVGKTNHGSYHDDGGSGTCLYWEDFRNPGAWGTSLKLMTWHNLIPLSTDENAPEWMRYEGEWGGDNLNDGVWSPRTQSNYDNLCNIPGCKGSYGSICTICGCSKSDVRHDETM